ncbi:hypothetical protein [Rhodoflexus caldus]|uniref:hypothetical protein n=1 Tax=Rhodoflexus caldus TaxID=2891236 RepID=UPI00202A493E|nr:hypothetical protein [Rhodoflexus caldus]
MISREDLHKKVDEIFDRLKAEEAHVALIISLPNPEAEIDCAIHFNNNAGIISDAFYQAMVDDRIVNKILRQAVAKIVEQTLAIIVGGTPET